MATSNKAQDPAAAALSAIEEALNLSADAPAEDENKALEISTPIFPKASDPDKTPKVMRRYPEGPALGAPSFGPDDRSLPRLPEVEEHPLFVPKKPESGKSAGQSDFAASQAPVQPAAAPANDDRHSVGAMLRALNQRPSPAPLVIAGLLSLVWLVLAGLYFGAHRAELLVPGASALRPETALFAIIALGPVIFFVITALLARRAQEMRLTARSMVEIAMRLSAPETIASEQMVTLSQAIRREIVSMGDGIERALARAGELETLVRSEVSNLERSYSENERRIRSLVDELTTERESMLANSERMRAAIGSAQDSFARELDSAAGGLTENLNGTGNRITNSLGAKAEEIRFSLAQAGEDLVGTLACARRGHPRPSRPSARGLEASIGRANSELAQSFNQRLSEIDAHLNETGEAFASHITQRLNDASERAALALSGATSAFDQVSNELDAKARRCRHAFARQRPEPRQRNRAKARRCERPRRRRAGRFLLDAHGTFRADARAPRGHRAGILRQFRLSCGHAQRSLRRDGGRCHRRHRHAWRAHQRDFVRAARALRGCHFRPRQ